MVFYNNYIKYILLILFFSLISISFERFAGLGMLMFSSIVLIKAVIDYRHDIFFRLSVLLIILLFLSTVFFWLFNMQYPENDVYLRLRYWVIQIVFGYSTYYLFSRLNAFDKHFLVLFLKVLMFLLMIYGVFQYVTNEGGFASRINLMVNEPSQAGGVWGFYISLLLYFVKIGVNNYKSYFFILVSVVFLLMIGSKGAVMALSLWILLFSIVSWKGQKKYLLIIFYMLFLVLVNWLYYDKIQYLIRFVHLLNSFGFDALSYSFAIWDSYIIRFYGIYFSILSMFQYPLGVGAGGFKYIFLEYVNAYNLLVDSKELTGVVQGYLYVTSKSYFLELMISSSLFSLIIIANFLIRLYKAHGRYLLLIVLFVFLQGVFVELAPYYAFVGALYGLYESS